MTDLLNRPTTPRRRPEPTRPPSVILAALAATAWAGVIGLVSVTLVVLLAWTADSRLGSSAGSALRLAGAAWLVAHGSGVRAGAVSIGMIPLGLTLLPIGLLWRAGSSLGRAVRPSSLRDAGVATGTLALTYGLLGVVVAGLVSRGFLHVNLLRAFVVTAVVAGLAGGLGVLRGSGCSAEALDLLPDRVRTALHAALVIVAVTLAGGALLVAGSLLVSAGRTRELFDSLHTGTVGGLALLLLSVALVPNMAIFGSSYAVGPGFAIGTGTSVGLTGTVLGPVPALPPLAALPETAATSPALWVLIGVPVLGGLLAGVVVARREQDRSLNEMLLTTVAAVGCAGVVLGVLALLAGGGVGVARLATIGPSGWQVALAVAAEAVLPALGAAWWTEHSLGRRVERSGAGRASAD